MVHFRLDGHRFRPAGRPPDPVKTDRNRGGALHIAGVIRSA